MNISNNKTNIYIIGCKGIPARYGGFETFVENLTKLNKNPNINYHIACMQDNTNKTSFHGQEKFTYNNANCFSIDVPNIGSGKAILYDIKALKTAIEISKKNKDEKPIFYILACRIGPFLKKFKSEIKELNGKLYLNPDGHEWLRKKWIGPIRKYWKISERLMVSYSDKIICDSVNIEKYIKQEYNQLFPNTCYISYGTDLRESYYKSNSSEVIDWFKAKNINENEYYLIVGRFVPENNYEIMIKEFLCTETLKNLVIVTDFENNNYFEELNKRTNFKNDSRVKFVGTVYDQELLKYIRQNAFAYIHGHEVGGTNPSLLEALFFTKLNLLLNVPFNEEVGSNTAIYWDKSQNSLATIINTVEKFNREKIDVFEKNSKSRISKFYSWEKIVSEYDSLFLEKV